MKEKLKKIINKNLKMIVIVAIVIALALGFLLMLISGNDEERDQVPIDPTAEQQEDRKDKKERKMAQSNDHPGVSDVALNMYNARVDDISDTVQVAQLLEASEMRKELGGYIATLELEDNSDVLIISYEKQLMSGEDNTFDEIATWYAEQFLALIEEADEVRWNYEIEKTQAEINEEKAAAEKKAAEEAAKKEAEAAKEEKDSDKDKKDSDKEDKKSEKKETEVEITIEKYKKVEKSLTLKQANDLLKTDVKGYSKSPELVQTLLNNQKGIV